MIKISPRGFILLFLIFLSFGGSAVFANLGNSLSSAFCQSNTNPTPEYGWKINSMEVAAQILDNGDMKIREKISVNFDISKHGIYRTIPLLFEPKGTGYKTSNFSAIKVESVNVLQDGNPATFTSSERTGSACPSNFLASEYNKEQFIKIGNSNSTIVGPHEYIISYLVKNALRDDRGYPELYWNMIGQGWGVDIDQAKIRITKSGNLEFSTDKIFCYSGIYGSTDSESCQTFIVDEGTIDFTINNLRPYHGVTVQTAIKPDYTAQLSSNLTGQKDRSQEYVLKKWYYLLAFLPFLYFVYIWNKDGKDPETRGVIAPRFDAPDAMSPAQAGMVLDQSVDNVDIAAIIISIAQKGWMKITYRKGEIFGIGEDYIFEKEKETTKAKTLTEEEKHIFDNIFVAGRPATPLSSLKNTFYLVIDETKAKLYSWAVLNNYLKSTPGPIQGAFVPGYVLLGIVWYLAISNSSFVMIAFAALSTILSIIVLFMYRFYTTKGKAGQEEILGLKMYMSTAEKDRIEFHNAPAKSPELFLKLLPYAMALGVVKIWADKFEGLNMQPPTWYVGPYSHFNATVFANDMTRASSSFASTMTSVPSSSGSGGGGGGFSGGGGGGGGGGSW